MHLLGDFIYNNTKYLIYINNKKFTFSKVVNNEEVFALSEEEHNLIKEVLKQILPTGNIIKLNNVIYNRHKYNHYLDVTNDLHYFYGQNNNIKDLADLCYLYNNEVEYVCDKHLNNEDKAKKRYQRLVKANKILITLNISLVAFLSIIPKINPDINRYINNPVTLAIRELDNRVMTLEEVYDYLDQNPYLSEKEKEYIHKFEDFIITELPYTNYQDLKENLMNMRTIYHEEAGEFRGTWTYQGKEKYNIDIYNSKSNGDLEESDYSTFSHEVLHAFTVNYGHQPRYMSPFYEFINMVLNNEFVSNEGGYYQYDIGYSALNNEGYALMELFNTDTLRRFHAGYDGNILLRELEMIIPDQWLGIKLFNTFNDYYLMLKSHTYTNEELNSIKSELKTMINRYYLAKNKQNISENIYMAYLLDVNTLINKLASSYNDYVIEFQFVNMKYYFNAKIPNNKEFILRLKSPETGEVLKEVSLDDTASVENDLLNIFSDKTK